MGSVWWLIKDVICLPHGEDSYFRHKLAYGLMGGVLTATIYHPANFIYGIVGGMVFGALKTHMELKSLPKNFELKMKNVN